MKNKWLLWGGVAVVAYLIYKNMTKGATGAGKELAPPPTTSPAKPKPSVTASENTISEEL